MRTGHHWKDKNMERDKNRELIYLNAFNHISFIGSKRLGLILDHFDSAFKAWFAPISEYQAIPELTKYTNRLEEERLLVEPEKEWERLENQKIKCLDIANSAYPYLLKQIYNPPAILYYRGDISILGKSSVAMVGSRKCTFYGKEVASKLASGLAANGINVVSGMALGIDTAAHQGVLDNNGLTVAVLGCSLDYCYPPRNRELMDLITTNGCVISEFPLGSAPLPQNFPQRNRIISGLSLGTVVVEATEKSGAMITANLALEQNREVLAVPGNIGSPYSRGCHRLIKEGAKLVENIDDIISELLIDIPANTNTDDSVRTILNETEKKLLELIPYQPIHMDNIVRTSGISISELSASLLSLELKSHIRQTPGKYFCRI